MLACLFSNKLTTTEMEELVMSDSAIKTAFDASDIFMQDIDERLKYINRQMSIMDYNTDMRVSREEGFIEGRDQMAINIAIDMLRDNKPIEKIIKYSHLPEARVKKLAQQIK